MDDDRDAKRPAVRYSPDLLSISSDYDFSSEPIVAATILHSQQQQQHADTLGKEVIEILSSEGSSQEVEEGVEFSDDETSPQGNADKSSPIIHSQYTHTRRQQRSQSPLHIVVTVPRIERGYAIPEKYQWLREGTSVLACYEGQYFCSKSTGAPFLRQNKWHVLVQYSALGGQGQMEHAQLIVRCGQCSPLHELENSALDEAVGARQNDDDANDSETRFDPSIVTPQHDSRLGPSTLRLHNNPQKAQLKAGRQNSGEDASADDGLFEDDATADDNGEHDVHHKPPVTFRVGDDVLVNPGDHTAKVIDPPNDKSGTTLPPDHVWVQYSICRRKECVHVSFVAPSNRLGKRDRQPTRFLFREQQTEEGYATHATCAKHARSNYLMPLSSASFKAKKRRPDKRARQRAKQVAATSAHPREEDDADAASVLSTLSKTQQMVCKLYNKRVDDRKMHIPGITWQSFEQVDIPAAFVDYLKELTVDERRRYRPVAEALLSAFRYAPGELVSGDVLLQVIQNARSEKFGLQTIAAGLNEYLIKQVTSKPNRLKRRDGTRCTFSQTTKDTSSILKPCFLCVAIGNVHAEVRDALLKDDWEIVEFSGGCTKRWAESLSTTPDLVYATTTSHRADKVLDEIKWMRSIFGDIPLVVEVGTSGGDKARLDQRVADTLVAKHISDLNDIHLHRGMDQTILWLDDEMHCIRFTYDLQQAQQHASALGRQTESCGLTIPHIIAQLLIPIICSARELQQVRACPTSMIKQPEDKGCTGSSNGESSDTIDADGAEENTSSGATPEHDAILDPYIGKKVRKSFNGKLYDGVVTRPGSFVVRNGERVLAWRVQYDDNDKEDYELNDLLKILLRPRVPDLLPRCCRAIELFSGHQTVTDAFLQRGFSCMSVDCDPEFHATNVMDVLALTRDDVMKQLKGMPHFMWISPPCTTNSLLSGGTHRKASSGEWDRTARARRHDVHLVKSLESILASLREDRNFIFVIENPYALMDLCPLMTMIKHLCRIYTVKVDYCVFGRDSPKPTNLWTNDQGLASRLSMFTCQNMCPLSQKHSSGVRGNSHLAHGVIPPQLALQVARYVQAKLMSVGVLKG